MEHSETLAHVSAQYKLSLWLRYVGDIFVVWRHGAESLGHFFSHLSSINSSIQFTMEIDSNNVIPFLDVLFIREVKALITTFTETTAIPADISNTNLIILHKSKE
jgi:hypothetical protein